MQHGTCRLPKARKKASVCPIPGRIYTRLPRTCLHPAVCPSGGCRDAMREGASEDDLRAIVSVAVDRKRAAHAGMFELASAKNRAMVKIGG